LSAAAHRLAMRHPLPRTGRRQAHASSLDRRQRLRPKDLGHRLLVEQVGALPAAPLASPALRRHIDRRRGDDEMDMPVEVEATRVRAQDRDRPRRPLQLPVVLTEAQHRFPGAAHQGIEDDVGVRRSESAPLGRQCEGQQKWSAGTRRCI